MDPLAQTLEDLRTLRDSFYRCFGRRADALFELTDALLTAGSVPSPPHLSLAPVDARRVKPAEDANEVGAGQVRALVQRLPEPEAVPICVFDACYDPVKLQRELEGCPARILVRLHSNRVFYAEPETSSPRPVGRPRSHGEKFDLKDPARWPEPSVEHRCETDDYGSVRVRCWSGLHPKTRRIGERYGCQKAPVVQGCVVLVEVGKLPRETRKPKKLWLWWSGEGEANLALIWRAYCRRFDLEHTIRFMKQTLGWSAPRFRHPEQADRWTWLVLAAYAQLRLARTNVADARLPWERPQRPRRLTPTRVLRSFATLLAVVGTPAKPPKPCGRSPGRPKGSRSGSAKRHPALKTAA